jgi:hypothetical protein
MHREAVRLMADSEYLKGRIDGESNGAYLLDLLAFEILLKCCVVLETGQLERGHNYLHIFLKLPLKIRTELVNAAAIRMGPTTDYGDICWLLDLFSSNFIRMRYPYEAYEGMTEETYLKIGSEWIDRGGLVEEATFDFRPDELRGLLYALSAHAVAAQSG